MALLGQTKLGLAAVVLTVFLTLSSTGEGFKQELWLYTEEGNGLYFHTHVPDLASFSFTLPKITRRCQMGFWSFYSTVNYQKVITYGGDLRDPLICQEFNATNLKSLRYWSANDTTMDAISLYSGLTYDEEEIFVTGKAKTYIAIPIRSLSATGTSDWILHEGRNLDGKSVCYKVPVYSSYAFTNSRVPGALVNLTTIGSIFKGCDAKEFQLYKQSHLM